VRKNNISEIFKVSSDDPYFLEKGVEIHSKSNYFFCVTLDGNVYFTDSMGFYDLDTIEESINNGVFFAIGRLKKLSDDNFWSDDIGRIYTRLSEMGYRTASQIEDAYNFFEGHISMGYDRYLSCKEMAQKSDFRYYRELCIAKEAGFHDASDLDDAEKYKAPDMQSLEAVRILLDIKRKFKFDDLSQSLVAGVIATLAWKRGVPKIAPCFIDLDEMSYLHKYWSPEEQYDGFDIIENMYDLIEFLESSQGRTLGHYDFSNCQFQFSQARIYIDGANIAFKGLYKGEVRESLYTPDMEVLKSCYQRLLNENLGTMKIYINGLVVKRIMRDGPVRNKEIVAEFRNSGVIETSIKGEKADEPLLQKLRDDPFAYVVANDTYADDYHLTKRDAEHIILVKFHEKDFEFHGSGYESLKNWNAVFSGWKDQLNSLFYTKRLGTWPFSYESFRYSFRECC
jgi:hypothetical protein